MNYTQERDEFVASMAQEGLPVSVTRQILAMANRLQRYAELSCSSEAADRDRVPCPAIKSEKNTDCLCDLWQSKEDREAGKTPEHRTVPRVDVRAMRTQRQIMALLENRPGFAANFQGDPRGAVAKIAVPSGRTDDIARDGICVPSKGLPESFWRSNR
jgi:hypothetical protein